jgi:hypothetical protein
MFQGPVPALLELVCCFGFDAVENGSERADLLIDYKLVIISE